VELAYTHCELIISVKQTKREVHELATWKNAVSKMMTENNGKNL